MRYSASREVEYHIRKLVDVADLARLGRDIILTALDCRHEKTIADTVKEMTAKLDQVNWMDEQENLWAVSQACFAGQKELSGKLVDLVYNDIEPS